MTEINRAQPLIAAERAGAAGWNAIRLRPRAVLIAALAVVAIGVAMNWSWLVAAGIAPILVAIAPCAVMCALGLCMNRISGQACATEMATQKTADPAVGQATPVARERVASTSPLGQPQAQDEEIVPHA